jgi:glycosyltransferase involved in cell wall biosynthesis
MGLYRRVPLLRRINNALMSFLVGRAAAKLDLHDPVAWIYLITHEGAPIFKRASLTVYDCIDEWAGGTDNPSLKRFFADLDRRLCMSSDVLFLGSQSLAAPRRQLNACNELVPQGVDLKHFLPPAQPVIPAELAALRKPIIGLIGVLNRERLDVELLCHLADERPQWSIVLIGPVWKGLDTETLERRANIHLLGNKPKEMLGAYLAAFDVCILPYLINDFTRNIFPLKLFEYLASGKPFVSTPIPACAEFPRLIRTAAGEEPFLQAVDEAVAEDDAALRNERIALASTNDWDRRTADKARLVAQQLLLKTGGAPSAKPPHTDGMEVVSR